MFASIFDIFCQVFASFLNIYFSSFRVDFEYICCSFRVVFGYVFFVICWMRFSSFLLLFNIGRLYSTPGLLVIFLSSGRPPTPRVSYRPFGLRPNVCGSCTTPIVTAYRPLTRATLFLIISTSVFVSMPVFCPVFITTSCSMFSCDRQLVTMRLPW